MPFIDPDTPQKEVKASFVDPDSGFTDPDKTEETSAGKAFGKSAVEAVAPALGGFAGAGAAMTAAAPLAAGATAMGGPVAGGAVEVGAALAGGFGGSAAVAKIQDLVLKMVPQDLLKEYGFDKTLRAKETEQHPYASFAGSLAPNLLAARPGAASLKKRGAMAGVGGGIEAGTELVQEGKVDPTKVAMAAAFQSATPKLTKLGEKLTGISPTEHLDHPKATPKEEYVKQMTEKFGKSYEQKAGEYWDKKNVKPAVDPKEPITDQVSKLSDMQFQLRQQRTADTLEAQKVGKQVSDVAKSEDIYHAQPEEEGRTLTPEQQHVVDTEVKPLQEERNNLYKKAVEVSGGELPEELQPHNVRTTQKTWLDKAKSVGENLLGHSGFGKKAGTQKERTMLAVEYEDGTRQVVHKDGTKLSSFDENGKEVKTPLYKGTEDTEPRVGHEFEVNGKKAKVVQATTSEIEAQTGERYNKNTVANELNAITQLKAYIREKAFLQEQIPVLKEQGLLLSKDKISSPPKGYKGLQGESTLEKYWVHDRIAETFEDGILKGVSGTSLLERINSAAVGTMFWNPYPHLFNALDHWVGTIGWDLVKPWQYKSIAKSVMEAYRDVSTVNKNYLKYLDSGMGIQYGGVAAKGALDHIMKTMPKETIADLAKSWGMRPDKLVGAIYKGSKHMLWGGSDVMMISAYKHLASKRGVDVFNQALRNYVETHNPNYRIPTRIGYDALMKIPGMPEAFAGAVSRGMSQAMQSRAFNTFGRYHYGQFKSLGSSIKDIIVQNERSPSTRMEALSHAAFVMFNVGVVYPYVWDTIAKMMSGDPEAQQRRSGASTIPYTVWHMALGDEQVTKLLSEAYQLPPITKDIVEMATNRDLFTGKHIWEPEDTAGGKAFDVSTRALSTAVAPVKSLLDKRSAEDRIFEQMGIKLKTGEKQQKRESMRKKGEAAAKRRQKERGF